MTKISALMLASALAAICLSAPAAAGQQPGAKMTFREADITSDVLRGPFPGPWEFSDHVTVSGSGITMTCDRVKVWRSSDRRRLARLEAVGNIVVKGSYRAEDKTEWKVLGNGESATYDFATGQGVLLGKVRFQATNTADQTTVSVTAHRMTYDAKTNSFRFERQDNPVRVEWQEPAPEPEPVAASGSEGAAAGETQD